jgi:hypothetical protein
MVLRKKSTVRRMDPITIDAIQMVCSVLVGPKSNQFLMYNIWMETNPIKKNIKKSGLELRLWMLMCRWSSCRYMEYPQMARRADVLRKVAYPGVPGLSM